MIGPLSRIMVRYIAGALVAFGLLDSDLGDQIAVDPDLVMVTGIALGFAVEGFYAVAKRQGWMT